MREAVPVVAAAPVVDHAADGGGAAQQPAAQSGRAQRHRAVPLAPGQQLVRQRGQQGSRA